MSSEEKLTKPIADQIIELMISNIKKKEEFNEQLIEEIEGLHKSGDLKKAGRIIETIKPNSKAEE